MGKLLGAVLGPCAVATGKLTAEKLNVLLFCWSKAVDAQFPTLDFANTTGVNKFQTIAPAPVPSDVIVVTNYLWRPLLGHLAAALGDAGALMYETFMAGNERFGRPRNPDFLLRPGELLAFAAANDLKVAAFSEGEIGDPPRAVRQRLHARRRPVA